MEYIPVKVEVKVPSVEKVHDTVYLPKPVVVKVKEVDSAYYDLYKGLKDSIAKDSLFKEAITINEYSQSFEDTLQTINVYSKTRGTLLSQTVDYKTKEYTIEVEDSVAVKGRVAVSLLAEVGLPLDDLFNNSPVVKGGISVHGKNGNSLSVSLDTEGRIWLGKTWKIKLRR